MKKFLSVLSILAITSTLAVSAAESQLQNYVNKKLAPVTQKEKDFNAKVEANRKANEAKKAEYKKQQEANRKAIEQRQAQHKANVEKAKKDAQARQDARKKAIQAEKDYWKSLKK